MIPFEIKKIALLVNSQQINDEVFLFGCKCGKCPSIFMAKHKDGLLLFSKHQKILSTKFFGFQSDVKSITNNDNEQEVFYFRMLDPEPITDEKIDLAVADLIDIMIPIVYPYKIEVPTDRDLQAMLNDVLDPPF